MICPSAYIQPLSTCPCQGFYGILSIGNAHGKELNYNTWIFRAAFLHFLTAEPDFVELRGNIHFMHPPSCQTPTLKTKLLGWGGHSVVLKWNVSLWLKVHSPELERPVDHLSCQHLLPQCLTSYPFCTVSFYPRLLLMDFMALFAHFKCFFFIRLLGKHVFKIQFMNIVTNQHFTHISFFFLTISPSFSMSFSLKVTRNGNQVLIVSCESPSSRPNKV